MFATGGHQRIPLVIPLSVHARRFAMYIAEAMGADAAPWTRDLEARADSYVVLANGQMMDARSRQDAHFRAWYSARRSPGKVGSRFKLDDCRIWMRLFFWACRKSGLAARAPHVFAYLVKWVGHFVAVYEYSARPFTRCEARWSADEANLVAYERTGYRMLDVIGVPPGIALRQLTEAERTDPVNWMRRPTVLSLIGL